MVKYNYINITQNKKLTKFEEIKESIILNNINIIINNIKKDKSKQIKLKDF